MRKLLGGFLLAVAAFAAQAQISGAVIPVICSDGTAASPCYTFTSAVNKGFWSPSTNTIGVSIGGTEVGRWSSTGYTATVPSSATSFFAYGGTLVSVATTGIQIAVPSALGYPVFDMVDTSRTANNKIAGFRWNGGSFQMRFMNDAYNLGATFFTADGGSATGITGITSNSGSGAWTHTNTRSSGVTNNGLVLADTVTGAQTPGFGTAIQWSSNAGSSLARIVFEAGGDGLNNQSQIGLYTQVSSGTLSKQVQINPVASATNYIALSGSAAGAPAISVEGASASISTTYGAKGAGSHLFYADYPSTPTLQFEVRRTASATNWIYVTGSNGSAPTLGTSGSSLNLSPIGLVALNIGSQASAVNFFTITATNSGGFPLFGVSGTDGNIGMDFSTKGTGGFRFFSDSATNVQFAVGRTAGATNFITVTGSNAGDPLLDTNGGNLVLRGGGSGGITVVAAKNTLRFFGFTFANIATHITTNGDIGYCSDCTIANPCAGGGTGAIAKRLNGVNVCN